LRVRLHDAARRVDSHDRPTPSRARLVAVCETGEARGRGGERGEVDGPLKTLAICVRAAGSARRSGHCAGEKELDVQQSRRRP